MEDKTLDTSCYFRVYTVSAGQQPSLNVGRAESSTGYFFQRTDCLFLHSENSKSHEHLTAHCLPALAVARGNIVAMKPHLTSLRIRMLPGPDGNGNPEQVSILLKQIASPPTQMRAN